LALSGEVKMQDIYMPIGGLSTHMEGIEARWEWMCEHWPTIVERLPPSMTMLSSVVSICVGGFTTKAQLEKAQAFFKDRDTKGFDRALDQSFDSIKAKYSWVERDTEDVEKWLRSHAYLEGEKVKL